MLKVISYKDISKNAGLFFGQFQLRYREFVERQNYAVRKIDQMEFDQYDSLAAVYLVYSKDGKTVLGCSRLTPVSYGCMLNDHFPDCVIEKSLLEADGVWEGTRFCIDSRLPADDRLGICQQICLGYIEYGLANGIDQIIGLMPTLVLRTVFERSGVVLDRLGPVTRIGAHSKIQAAAIRISEEQRRRVMETTGIDRAFGDGTDIDRRHVA